MHTMLREFFKNKGIRQKDLVAELGITQPYASALMTGRIAMSRNIAKKLSQLYDLSEGWLLTGQGPMMKNGEAGAVLSAASPNLQGVLPCSEPEQNSLVDVIRRQQEVIGKQQEMIQTLLKLLPDTK